MSENLSLIENEDSIIGSQNSTISVTSLPEETPSIAADDGNPTESERESPVPQNSPDETPSPAAGDGNPAEDEREASIHQNNPDETPSPAAGDGNPAENVHTTSASSSSAYENQGNEYSKLFLIFVGLFSIIFIGYIIYSGCVLRKSQDAIKHTYYKHINKADSLYVDLMKYNKDMTSKILEFNSKVVADSLIRLSLKNQNLSSKQYESLSLIILNHSNVIERCIR